MSLNTFIQQAKQQFPAEVYAVRVHPVLFHKLQRECFDYRTCVADAPLYGTTQFDPIKEEVTTYIADPTMLFGAVRLEFGDGWFVSWYYAAGEWMRTDHLCGH